MMRDLYRSITAPTMIKRTASMRRADLFAGIQRVALQYRRVQRFEEMLTSLSVAHQKRSDEFPRIDLCFVLGTGRFLKLPKRLLSNEVMSHAD